MTDLQKKYIELPKVRSSVINTNNSVELFGYIRLLRELPCILEIIQNVTYKGGWEEWKTQIKRSLEDEVRDKNFKSRETRAGTY